MPDNLHIGDIIELKNEFGEFYDLADGGFRAVIRDIKTQDGFQMVYVNWLAGDESPGWTFANHFEFVRDTNDILPKLQQQSFDPEDQYMDRVFRAIDSACESEAFFLLAMKKTHTPHGTIMIPELYCESNDETAAFLMEAQIMQIAADMFRNVVTEAVENFDGPED